MSPASFSTLRCCDTVDCASGSSSTMSPHMQVVRRARRRRILTRAGWPTALARSASSASASAPSTGGTSGASAGGGLGTQATFFRLATIAIVLLRYHPSLAQAEHALRGRALGLTGCAPALAPLLIGAKRWITSPSSAHGSPRSHGAHHMSLPVIAPPPASQACCSRPTKRAAPAPGVHPGSGRTALLLAPALAAWSAAYAAVRPLSEWLAFRALGLAPGSRLGQSVAFFLYDTPKVLLLLTLIVFLVGIVRSFFTPERTRAILAGRRESAGNALA